MPDGQQVSVEVERLRVEQAWRSASDGYIPMPMAAAMTFHKVHCATGAVISRRDYDEALNIAAAAVSRLIPLYGLSDRGERKQVPINLGTQRFTHGAGCIRSADGAEFRDISVKRSDLVTAMSFIARTGLPYSFVSMPAATQPRSPADR